MGLTERLAGAVSGWGSGGDQESGSQVKGDGRRQRCWKVQVQEPSSPPRPHSSTYSHLIVIAGGQVRCEAVPWPGCGPITGFSED